MMTKSKALPIHEEGKSFIAFTLPSFLLILHHFSGTNTVVHNFQTGTSVKTG